MRGGTVTPWPGTDKLSRDAGLRKKCARFMLSDATSFSTSVIHKHFHKLTAFVIVNQVIWDTIKAAK